MSDDHVMEDDGEEEAAEQETPDSAEWQAGEGELGSEGMFLDTVNCSHKICNRLCRETDLLIQFIMPHQVPLTLFPLPIMLLSVCLEFCMYWCLCYLNTDYGISGSDGETGGSRRVRRSSRPGPGSPQALRCANSTGTKKVRSIVATKSMVLLSNI